MTNVQITRTQIVVVAEVSQNNYGDLTFTDKAGVPYKVGTKRKKYFEGIIVPGAAVQLNFSTFKGTEYVYSAETVAEKIDFQERKDTSKIPLKGDTKPDIITPSSMSKNDWDEKDKRTRKSIERQKALELAVTLVVADRIKGVELLGYASAFENYLETGYKEVQPTLVTEAKKLGATEIKKGAN